MKKLYVNMPVGDNFGWAVCGKNMLIELNKLTEVAYVPDGFEGIKRSYKLDKMVKEITEKPNGKAYNFLAAIDNENPLRFKGDKNVGYMFWEQETIPEYLVEQLKAYDIIATGSTWNTEVVKRYGFDNVVTIHQGVDTQLFIPRERLFLEDKFVIFSGGNLEPRKAQDLVAQAVGYMQKKYPDVYLIATWCNIFAKEEENKDNFKVVAPYLNSTQTILTSLLTQSEIAKYIGNTDIGLFPNRSEGGTNLVMMEYMACGKPVIANYATGQKDVLSEDYAYLTSTSIDDIIDKLEYAYHHRDELKVKGIKAREAMIPFTWEKTAKEFLRLYE